jgi:hypothetical protein
MKKTRTHAGKYLSNTTRIFLIALSFVFLAQAIWSQSTPNTWAERIAPILYKNCTSCHHTGGMAPFPMMTYPQARNLHLAIHHAVLIGHMPPWPPDPKYRALAHQRILSDADKQAILDWADAGAPQGDMSKAPTPPVYTNAPAIPNADWVQRIPNYTVESNTDVYRCFPMRSNTTVDRFITGLECVPGNGSIVHHVLIFADQSNTCWTLDAADPKPGYTSFGGVGSNTAQLIGGWVPGSAPFNLPTGMGIKLPAGANIILQVHYGPSSSGKSDSTMLRLRTTTQTSREVRIAPILNHSLSLTNGPLFIPADATRTFNARYTMPADATIITIGPHMHYIGRKIKVWAVPLVGDTIPLIKIDNWHFHWQGSYMFKKALKLPRGARLESEAFYDNTIHNPNQPVNPPRAVSLGEGTNDEMMLVYFAFLAYQPGDENIVLETSPTDTEDPPLSKMSFSVYPNPSQAELTARFDLTEAASIRAEIFDYQGVLVKTVFTARPFEKGQNEVSVHIADLPSGVYFLKIQSDKLYGIQQFVKAE